MFSVKSLTSFHSMRLLVDFSTSLFNTKFHLSNLFLYIFFCITAIVLYLVYPISAPSHKSDFVSIIIKKLSLKMIIAAQLK